MANYVDPIRFDFVQVAEISELAPGQRLLIEVDDQPIAVFRVGDDYYAIGDVCTHDDGPLGDGELDDHQIVCPRHGARFDIRDGKALTLPAVVDTPWYPVRIKDGWIEVGILKQ